MPIKRLEFWARGHIYMFGEEEKAKIAVLESAKAH
jgi:hypothetical protein